jgi:hypothetical protein
MTFGAACAAFVADLEGLNTDKVLEGLKPRLKAVVKAGGGHINVQ